jgi:hypothetical protein
MPPQADKALCHLQPKHSARQQRRSDQHSRQQQADTISMVPASAAQWWFRYSFNAVRYPRTCAHKQGFEMVYKKAVWQPPVACTAAYRSPQAASPPPYCSAKIVR